ncbi:MAG: DMT family transporter [Candidatus Competibacteraceae bacterium]|nr:DMT family transporter [Candidatus Competibacteraceae bacterium]
MVLTYIKLLLSAVIWGGTFIAGRVISQSIDPFSAAFFRFAIASVFLFFIARQTEGALPLPRKHQYVPLALLGLTGIVLYNYFFFKGLQSIEAGRASVIVAQNPIFIALLSAYFFKESLTPTRLFAVFCSVVGAMIVITKGQVMAVFQSGFGVGELYLFGCIASWVTYSLLGKAVMTDLSPVLSVTYSVFIGTVIVFLLALAHGALSHCLSYSLAQWLSLFYLGLFGTVLGFIWFYQGIQRIGPMKSGLFINFVPISGALLGFLILGEPVTPSLAIGLLCVCTGLYLMNKTP